MGARVSGKRDVIAHARPGLAKRSAPRRRSPDFPPGGQALDVRLCSLCGRPYFGYAVTAAASRESRRGPHPASQQTRLDRVSHTLSVSAALSRAVKCRHA